MKVRELKRAVAEPEITWTVNDRLDDDEEVPQFPLGLEVPENIEEVTRAASPLDLSEALAEYPTANPLLHRRRIELGLAVESIAAGETPSIEARPAAVDWRNRWGIPWITTIRDQSPCGACVAFGVTALVEAMTRIEHVIWTERSEGDLRYGMQKPCPQGSWPTDELNWIRAHNGICDPGCIAWQHVSTLPAYNPTPDRNGRTVKIDGWYELSNVEQQKAWLDSVGPLSGCYMVYSDFGGVGTGVYRKTPGATEVGGHCILVVGYDDAAGCWICKNSWGSAFGDGGYFRIAYGEVNIDAWPKFGVRGTNPDPWTKRRAHAGAIFESGNGAAHRNFEMLATAGNQVRHWWREGSGAMQWGQGQTFNSDAAACPTFTPTTYNRNMEAVYLTTTRRLHHVFWDQGASRWTNGPVFGPPDAAGIPGFIQGDYGAPGNFEVVVRTADGRLNHWWRRNGPPWTWSDGGRFGKDIAHSGPALVQTRGRTLDVVAVRTDGRMQRFWRDDPAGFVWREAEIFGQGVASPPSLIEGQYGAVNERSAGNYELCVAVGGRVEHWWKPVAGATWQRSAVFGHDVQAVAGLLEGSFGFNLEVVVLHTDRKLQHYWRTGAGQWNEGVVIGQA